MFKKGPTALMHTQSQSLLPAEAGFEEQAMGHTGREKASLELLTTECRAVPTALKIHPLLPSAWLTAARDTRTLRNMGDVSDTMSSSREQPDSSKNIHTAPVRSRATTWVLPTTRFKARFKIPATARDVQPGFFNNNLG